MSLSFSHNRKNFTSCRVGVNMGEDGSSSKSCSKDIFVPIPSAENVQCFGLKIGHLRSSGSVGIVYAIIDCRKHRKVVRYTVGFDIGPNGWLRGGSTKSIDLPGWYGWNITAIDISPVDVAKQWTVGAFCVPSGGQVLTESSISSSWTKYK